MRHFCRYCPLSAVCLSKGRTPYIIWVNVIDRTKISCAYNQSGFRVTIEFLESFLSGPKWRLGLPFEGSGLRFILERN